MSKISRKLQEKVRLEAKNRCGYCQLPQNLNPMLLEIEHLQPIAKGGSDAEENLWLACRECNSHKSIKLTDLMKRVENALNSSIREGNAGTDISVLMKIKLK